MTAANLGSNWRAVRPGAPPSPKEKRVGHRCQRTAHRRGRERRYTVPNYATGDELGDRVQASIARDLLDLLDNVTS